MKKLIAIIPLMMILSGCVTADETKNLGGHSGVIILPDRTIMVENVQPENPNDSAHQTVQIGTNGVVIVEQSTGGAFENKMGKLKGILGMAKIYHVASVLCLIIGAVILSLPSHFSNKTGWFVCGAGGVMMLLGSILPNIGSYLSVVAVGGAAFGVYYLLEKRKAVTI